MSGLAGGRALVLSCALLVGCGGATSDHARTLVGVDAGDAFADVETDTDGGFVNHCPTFTRVFVAPNPLPRRGLGVAEVAASDPDGDELSYAWSSHDVGISMPDQAKTFFICVGRGRDELSVTVSDGDDECDNTLTLEVLCDTDLCEGVDCTSDNLCNVGSCNPATGLCEFQPKACEDDGDPCTYNHRCDPASGQCVSERLFCSGGVDGCTIPACAPDSSGCIREPLPDGTPCVDGLPPVGGFCSAGVCEPAPDARCPAEAPISGDACEGEFSCEYGQESCCGNTYPELQCQCFDGQFGCFFTDACLFPGC